MEVNGNLSKIQKRPPDGGWGWIIVIAFGISNIVIIPMISNFGLIFKDKFAAVNMPARDVSLIMNINSAFGMSMGLINGPLLRHFGYRKVAIVAGILFSTGIILTSFSNSFGEFVLTYGLIAASGYGLASSSFSLALNSYFKERRNKAVGISMTLTGIGPIMYPPIISALLINYGINGCVLILGAVCTHVIVAALLLQPVKWHMKYDLIPTTDNNIDEKSIIIYDDKQKNGKSITSLNKIDHEIDAQSIYGYEQVPVMRRVNTQRQMSQLQDLNETTVEHNYNNMKSMKRPKEYQRSISHVIAGGCSTLPPNELLPPMSELKAQPEEEDNIVENATNKKPPLRWFEAGSVDSVNLGSCVELFSEKLYDKDYRKSLRDSKIIEDNDNEIDDYPLEQKSLLPTQLSVEVLNDPILLDTTSPPPPSSPTPPPKKKSYFQKFRIWIVRFFDLDLLKDKIYVNILLGLSLAIFSEVNFSILTPFILNDLGYTTIEIASLMSSLGVADISMRFISPFIGDYFDRSPRVMYMLSLSFLMSCRFCALVVTSYKGMFVIFICLGIAKGVRTVYMSLVIPTYIPIERLASAAGLQMVTNGIVLMILGPVVGVIKDLTGSYAKCILFINFVTSIALTMWTIEMVYLRWRNRKRNTNTIQLGSESNKSLEKS